MENETLQEWFKKHSSEKEYQELFYRMDKTMKFIHNQGYYITNMDMDKIEINGVKIIFNKLSPYLVSEQKEVVERNIKNLSYVSVASYNHCLDFMNTQFIKSHFDVFSEFLPPDDVPYYKSVIVGNKPIYYSEYVEYNYRNQNKSSSDNNGKGQILSKATAIGKAYSLPDIELPTNNAAFVQSFLLPAITILISLITVILFFTFKI